MTDKISALTHKILEHLQANYRRTGRNDPVEWRSLANKLNVTEDKISEALKWALDSAGGQIDLRSVGRDFIQLGPRALNDAGQKK
jgi:hypothetical protein